MRKVIKFSTFLALKNSGNLDSDFDGLADWEELELETDPFNADTDGNGVKDGEQYKAQKIALELTMLKDLFVPHQGNGFKPQALHPGRLMFHATAALAIKAIMVALIVLMPLDAWLAQDFMAEQGQEVVDLTNNLRESKNLPALLQSQQLTAVAEKKVNNMFVEQYFAHVGPANQSLADWLKQVSYNFTVAGENLAMGYSLPGELLEAWKNSPTHYKNIIDPEFKQIGVAMATGKFNNQNTILAAQIFGNQESKLATSSSVSSFLASSEQERPVKATVNFTVAEKALPSSKLVYAKVDIDEPVTRAMIHINGQQIALAQTDTPNEWSGSALVEQGNGPQVPASLEVTNENGQARLADVSASVSSVKPSIYSEYNFLRQNGTANKLWALASAYYAILLVLAVVSLGMNIFIQIKKQHPHLIVSTVSLVGLLAILIIV